MTFHADFSLVEKALIERLEDVARRIGAVHFGTGRESMNNMKPVGVPHGCEHKLLL
jgi:hypothetical protein